MGDLIRELKGIVGAGNCLAGDDDRARYEADVTRQHVGKSLAVVRPGSTAEVSAVMRLANRTRTPVVPLSGNTGLAGGGYAGNGGDTIILSLERMNRVLSINTASRLARVEAGVILADLQAAAEAEGLVFPLMFGARGSCMIGGNLSTNAGGSNVVRYGNTRSLVLGLEAVLPDGEVLDLMSELRKDNTGYDLKDLLIGAEGTLGVITGAVVQLFARPKAYATAMVSVPDIAGGLQILHRLQSASGGGVEAFEYMPREYFRNLRVVDPKTPVFIPEDAEVGIMIEIAATSDRDATPDADGSVPVAEVLTGVLGELMESGAVLDATVAQNETQRAQMWKQREMAFMASVHRGPVISTDVAVPLDRVDEFLHRADAAILAKLPNAEFINVAHLGDGNLHYTILPDASAPGAIDEAVEDMVHTIVEDVVADLGGSFSAEHGIGLHKLGTMRRRKNPVALQVMRAIKAALDPNNIMNPGKTIP
ncbi:MAG: FAD-binding oxidoreductase [Rhodobacteraceae bacterium]|nr:FAD-binding oxidoreductase [Paracoccaceae bacterium]